MVETQASYPFATDTELNQDILKIDSKIAKISIPKPQFKKSIVYMIKKDKNGEPLLNDKGETEIGQYEIEEFAGFKEDLVDFPVPDCFNNDMAKSYLVDSEVYFVRVAVHSYAYFMQRYVRSQREACLPMLNFIASLIHATTTTGGARHGFRMLTAKTKISKTGDEIAKIRAEEEIKDKGFWGRLWVKGDKK